ncbi:MAG: nucleotidyltransferase domain-containing protein [Deltaproteobacteria bacterium]|nr:nucleotidyltransferase domain-containing protein [Deltaproteobacteria bacterium]
MKAIIKPNDPVIDFVVLSANSSPLIRSVRVFGSRAKESANDKSDYDLAFEIDPALEKNWGEFCSRLREDNPKLNTLDLVRMDEISDTFRKKILREGSVIYEKN